MNKKSLGTFCSGVLLLGLSSAAQATLFDRGGGMIYDSDQNLTWLQDANYAATQYANSGGVLGDADGEMLWSNASTWVSELSYGGYTDWRMPTNVETVDANCTTINAYNGDDCGYNVDVLDSEMAYMWYSILGNTALYDTSGSSPQPGWGLTNTSADGISFLNLQSDFYWSGTENVPGGTEWYNGMWYFDTNDGFQGNNANKANYFYAWAVRSGDVANVLEPTTLLLFGLGLAGLGVVRRGQSQR